MLAKASPTRLEPVSAANAFEPAGPLEADVVSPIEPRIEETARVKSIRFLSARPNGVGSIDAMRLPDTANGTVPVTVAPANETKVRFWLAVRTLTVSAVPTSWRRPTME